MPAATEATVVVPDEFVSQPVFAGIPSTRMTKVADEVGGPYRPPEGTEGRRRFHSLRRSRERGQHRCRLARQREHGGPPDPDHRPDQEPVPTTSEKLPQRDYLGIVVAGPFAEPDGLRADSSIVVATTVQGQIFLPRYHGRAFVQILGEEVNGQLVPPRYRPRPNSPVFPLSTEETAKVLQVGGNARLGLVVGQESIEVGIPTDRKSVLPRHLGILGTTGGGKSTTVSRLVHQLQKAGVATVLIDIEGEYTEMDQLRRPTRP